MRLIAVSSTIAFVVTLCLCAPAQERPAQESHPTLRWTPEVHAVYRLHSHHLNAANHAAVLRTFAADAKSIPREDVKEHLDEIERSVNSSQKALKSLPANIPREHREKIGKIYDQSLERVRGLRELVRREAFSQGQIPTLAKPLHGDLWSGVEDLDRLNQLLGLPVIHGRRKSVGATP